jgi:hypothetical protein
MTAGILRVHLKWLRDCILYAITAGTIKAQQNLVSSMQAACKRIKSTKNHFLIWKVPNLM